MVQKIIVVNFLMRAPKIKLSFCLCLLFLLTDISIAQENNPTDYPYGGVKDSLGRLTFKKADFGRATFGGVADFGYAKFHSTAYFGSAKFDGRAYFRGATFHTPVNFAGAKFDIDANFEGAKFEDVIFFKKAVFKGVVNFRNTAFKKEIDFRQANFDSVISIYLEDITFPDGKLLFYWEQFKGKDSLRIKIRNPPADSIKDEHYTRIEIIYHKLRDNFIAQGDKASADDVMYELRWQRDEILEEFWWGLYGTLFGYGYQPWRFLLYIVTPIILLFAIIWYWFYYILLVFINQSIFPKNVDASALRTKEIHFKIKNIELFKLHITDFKYGIENVNRLTRYWHTIFFSASVLLGIRFKKDWSTVFPSKMVGRKTFIYFVTLEWILGIGLFVTFALFVEGIRFSFIKDLLGF